MLWTELHKTANRIGAALERTIYADGMMLLVKATKVAGVIEPL